VLTEPSRWLWLPAVIYVSNSFESPCEELAVVGHRSDKYAGRRHSDGLSARGVAPSSEPLSVGGHAKDEFFNVKNVTRDDLLAAHRIPPQLMGIVPSNTGGFGAADTAAEVFGRNEIEPLQRRFAQLNDWIGEEVVRFNSYSIKPAASATQ